MLIRLFLATTWLLAACGDDAAATVPDAGGGARDSGVDPLDSGVDPPDSGVDAPDSGLVQTDAGATGERTGTRLANAVCARESECCPGNAGDCSLLGSVLDGQLTRDGVVLDTAAYDECITRIASADCGTVAAYGGRLALRSLCDPLTEGTLALGARCGGLSSAEQCASGSCVDGACAARAGEGEACGMGGTCLEGLACSLAECVVPTAPGESCESTNACTAGHDCFRMADEVDARCHPLRTIGVGEECGPGTACELGPEQCFCPVGGGSCSYGLCGNASRCRP